MNTKFLLPHRFKALGWLISLPAFVLMVLTINLDFSFKFLDYQARGVHNLNFNQGTLFNLQSNNFTDEIGGVLLIAGLLLVAFSKEKQEDERIAKIRLESLLWAVLVNSLLITLAIIFFYNTLFLMVMTYNICTPLILFIARFNLLMLAENRKLKNAQP